MSIPGPSTPIIPSSRAPPAIPRTPSSTIPHPSINNNISVHSSSVNSSSLSLRKASIYEKNLHRKSIDVSISSYAFLFSEIIQYLQKKSTGIQDLERRLNDLGYHIGQRVLELITLRDGKNAKREIKILGVLQFIHTTVWKTVYGKPADGLEKSRENANEYMIIDQQPMITQFISVPKDMKQLNCAALSAGIIEAVLDGYLFTANVTAHTVETDEYPMKTVFLIKFDPLVLEREAMK